MDTRYRKKWTVTVSKSGLYTDINTMAHAYSEAGGAAMGLRAADRVAADTENDLDRHIVTRLCDHRMGDIRTVLSRFVTGTETSGTDYISTGDYALTLWVPSDADGGTLNALTDLIHDYVADGALADWYAQLGAANAAPGARAAENLAKIRSLIYYRPMPC